MQNSGVLMFAMEGLFSRVVFDALLEQSTEFSAIVLPARSSITNQPVRNDNLHVLNTASIESLARFHQIPLYYVSGKDIVQYQHILDKHRPELLLVACFPYRVPATVYRYPRLGAYNIHPSLLPAYRGPVPLFWQFYNGDMKSGISIHEIDADFDTGNIVLQQTVILADGISGPEANLLLARAAFEQSKILLDKINNEVLPRIKQEPNKASYYTWPGLAQFTIPDTWPVRRAFNFIRGTMHWKQTYKVKLAQGKEILIHDALAYNDTAKQLPTNTTQIQLAFSDGILFASI